MDRLCVEIHHEIRDKVVINRYSAAGVEIYFEISGAADLDLVASPNSALIAFIFYAMRIGSDLHIRGGVCKKLLANIEEFQDAWVSWRPEAYRKISVSADYEICHSYDKDLGGGVFAFSGGVDSAFTFLRNISGDAGRRSIKPAVALIVHGFDVPLSDNFGFARAKKSIEVMLSGFPDVHLVSVRTNWREVALDWEMEFFAGLASCLHQVSSSYNVAVAGADEDYGNIIIPWGSNPITNPLLSSGDFSIVTDGAGYTRSERVGYISGSHDFSKGLRVCWQSDAGGENCGSCEKCIRTKLNFMANGVAAPCFVDGVKIDDVLRIKISNPIKRAYLMDVVMAAKRNGVDNKVLWALRLRLMSKPLARIVAFCRRLLCLH